MKEKMHLFHHRWQPLSPLKPLKLELPLFQKKMEPVECHFSLAVDLDLQLSIEDETKQSVYQRWAALKEWYTMAMICAGQKRI